MISLICDKFEYLKLYSFRVVFYLLKYTKIIFDQYQQKNSRYCRLMHQLLPQQNQYSDILQNCYQTQTKNLNLSWKPQTWAGVLQSRNWDDLLQINLGNCSIDVNVIQQLKNVHFPSLKKLKLLQNQIDTKSLQQLLKNQWPQLKTLNLSTFILILMQIQYQMKESDCQLMIKLLKDWLSLLLVPFYQILDRTGLSRKGFICAPDWKADHLQILTLNNNPIGSTGVKYLIKADLPCLNRIELYSCIIGPEGAKHLTKSKWQNLKHLNLNSNKIQSEGHSLLCTAKWPKLSFLANWQYSSIQYINMVVSEWPKKISIQINPENFSIRKQIRRIFKNRFCV